MKRILIPVVLITASCSRSPDPTAKQPVTPPRIQAGTIAVSMAEWAGSHSVPGTVRARTTAHVSAKIMAYVREVHPRVGDTVRSGQILITLDPKDADSAIRRAEAARREAQSAEAEIQSAIAAAKVQVELAQVTHKRMAELHAKRSISNQEFDESAAKLRLSQANLDMASARLPQLKSKLDSAGEAIRSANVVREDATIAAPFAGVVIERMAEPGNLAAPGAPLLVIEQAGSYRLEAPVEESMISKVRRGQQVDISIDALGKSLRGTVGEIVPGVDPGSRSFLVKIDLPAANVRTGMYGRAMFPAEAKRVLAIPAGAVRKQGSLESVFVADQGVVRSRLITTGDRNGDQVQVLSGLSENERIVHPIPAAIEDGARLEETR